MKKMIILAALLSTGSAVQAQDYKHVKDLLVDFLNLRKKTDKPLSYWLEELMSIIEHDKKFDQFIAELKRAKQCPDKLQKAFRNHGQHFDNGVKVHLVKAGADKIKKAFEARCAVGTPTRNLTPGETVVVMQTFTKRRTGNSMAPTTKAKTDQRQKNHAPKHTTKSTPKRKPIKAKKKKAQPKAAPEKNKQRNSYLTQVKPCLPTASEWLRSYEAFIKN